MVLKRNDLVHWYKCVCLTSWVYSNCRRYRSYLLQSTTVKGTLLNEFTLRRTESCRNTPLSVVMPFINMQRLDQPHTKIIWSTWQVRSVSALVQVHLEVNQSSATEVLSLRTSSLTTRIVWPNSWVCLKNAKESFRRHIRWRIVSC